MDGASVRKEILANEPRLAEVARGVLARARAAGGDEQGLAEFAQEMRALFGFERLPDPVTGWVARTGAGELVLRRTLDVGKLELRRWEGTLELFRRPPGGVASSLKRLLVRRPGKVLRAEGSVESDIELLEATFGGPFERVLALREGRKVRPPPRAEARRGEAHDSARGRGRHPHGEDEEEAAASLADGRAVAPHDAPRRPLPQAAPSEEEAGEAVRLETIQRASAAEPAVSVIISARGRPDLVVRATRSALAQDGPALEVIVVVDGCAETARAARSLEGEPRLVLLESAVNLGPARSRNRALELARGALVVELDAADALEPGAILAVLAAFDDRPHVGAVYGDLVLEDQEGNERGISHEPDFPSHGAFLEAPFDTPFLAYRRDVGRAAGGVDEAALRCENAGLLGRISRTHAVRRLPRVLLRHRVDPKNPALRHRPADCASCASSTSCRLAALRRRHATRESWKLRKLSLVLTTRCNLDCAYCYTRRYKWDLSTEDCLRLLVQGRDQGAERVAFTGGEPSLHEGFDTIIEERRRPGLRASRHLERLELARRADRALRRAPEGAPRRLARGERARRSTTRSAARGATPRSSASSSASAPGSATSRSRGSSSRRART